MKEREIREINGQKVFMKEIAPFFWLINDVLVEMCPSYILTDDNILWLLSLKTDPILPYKGLAKGWVLSIVESATGDGFVIGNSKLLNFDESMQRNAEDAYAEYRSWAGI